MGLKGPEVLEQVVGDGAGDEGVNNCPY